MCVCVGEKFQKNVRYKIGVCVSVCVWMPACTQACACACEIVSMTEKQGWTDTESVVQARDGETTVRWREIECCTLCHFLAQMLIMYRPLGLLPPSSTILGLTAWGMKRSLMRHVWGLNSAWHCKDSCWVWGSYWCGSGKPVSGRSRLLTWGQFLPGRSMILRQRGSQRVVKESSERVLFSIPTGPTKAWSL